MVLAGYHCTAPMLHILPFPGIAPTQIQKKRRKTHHNLNTKKIELGDFTVSTLSGTLKYTNGSGNVKINVAKSGYKAIGIAGFSISSTYIAPSAVNLDFDNQKVNISARHINDENASGSVNAYAMVLYVKTD